MERRRRTLLLAPLPPLPPVEQADRAGMDEASLVAARELRNTVVHVRLDGSRVVERNHTQDSAQDLLYPT